MAPSLPRAPSASPAGASRPPEVRPTPPRPWACTLSSAAKSSPFYAGPARKLSFGEEARVLGRAAPPDKHIASTPKSRPIGQGSNRGHATSVVCELEYRLTPPSHGGNTGSN